MTKNNKFLPVLRVKLEFLKDGFTLLELIVCIGIFSALTVGVVGVMIQLMNAQQKAAEIQAVIDNLRFNLELMSREMRTGLNFITSGPQLLNCSDSLGKEIRFTSFNQGVPQFRVYYLADTDRNGTGDAIMRIATPDILTLPTCAMAERFTSEDVVVEDWDFLLRGAGPFPSDGQPFITLNLRIKSKSAKVLAETRMNLQVTVAQRVRDL